MYNSVEDGWVTGLTDYQGQHKGEHKIEEKDVYIRLGIAQ